MSDYVREVEKSSIANALRINIDLYERFYKRGNAKKLDRVFASELAIAFQQGCHTAMMSYPKPLGVAEYYTAVGAAHKSALLRGMVGNSAVLLFRISCAESNIAKAKKNTWGVDDIRNELAIYVCMLEVIAHGLFEAESDSGVDELEEAIKSCEILLSDYGNDEYDVILDGLEGLEFFD